ncbi:2-phosphosulfolactate phosphatase [Brackiella oedipodis]|uniref:2-phosphosulfolactate phosphatase n=1 Tax=Brackiella oedipodis TaxID=124225 RepID=UPI00048E3115|nr:2-phosphosulfolactate phosphatase [Brackiella oedipodis]
MRRIEVVLRKEDLKQHNHQSSIAIVLDIIFATSSITSALEAGVNKVYTALSLDDAIQLGQQMPHDNWVIAGEQMAQAFEGYMSYEPLTLNQPQMAGKDLIYATTNGTVALRYAATFAATYAASLRNANAVIKHVLAHNPADQDIVLICSGSHGHFSLEDFYGAGCMVACLLAQGGAANFNCSDAAWAAYFCYANAKAYDVISQGRLAHLMQSRGMSDNLDFICQQDATQLVGVLHQNYIQAIQP